MKKNTLSRILALALTVVLLSTQFIPFVWAEGSSYNQDIPRIDMRGFMNADILEDKDNPESKVLWPLSAEEIALKVAKISPDLIEFAQSKPRNWKILVNPVNELINDIFGSLKCDTSGNPVKTKSGAYFKKPTAEELEESLDVNFCYDWRVDPFVSASQLNDLVEYLTEDMGYEQVVLECHSNGGVVMLTYLATYGREKVRSCCFSASAIYGAGFAGELVKGNLVINAEGLAEYLDGVFENNESSVIYAAMVATLRTAGIMDSLSDFINGIIENLHDEIYTGSIMPIFGNWVNIWSMVPDEDMEAGMDYTFNQLLKDDGNDYSGLKQKIYNYTDNIRSQRETHLDNIGVDCNVYVFSLYGYTGIPITTNWYQMNDGVLLSKDTSMGASFVDTNSNSVYNQGAYISPNGKVNGASARFRDQTWYFRGCRHSMVADNLTEMSKTLLYTEGQATITTYPQYPQFMRYDAVNAIAPDDYTEDGGEVDDFDIPFLKKIFEFFQMCFESIMQFIGVYKKDS